jgi:hypothetical protein
MKKSLYEPKLMESIDKCMRYCQKINDLILHVPEEDLDEPTLALRNIIRKHPLFMRRDFWPKDAIVAFLSNYQQEDDSCVKQLQKITEIINEYNGLAGLKAAFDRLIADEELHMEVRTVLDGLRKKYKTALRGK